MAYTNLNFVPGEILTAAKMNLLAANDASFRDGTGILDNTIQLTKINNIFSTTEQTIGIWVDGKTIYRKSATGTNLNFKNLGVTFDKITRTNMMVKTIQNEWRPIPWCYSAGSNVDGTWNAGYFIRQNGDLVFQFGNSIAQNFKEWVLIIEYTKP